MTPSGSQHPAVAAVASRARVDAAAAVSRLAVHGLDEARVAQAIAHLRANSRLTLNFHPDRRDSMSRTVAAGLRADGRYRSQFETGISNGGRFAVRGGDRPRWEALLFGRAYDDESLTRPVYGALDLFQDSYGGAPRFGSSFVVLAAHCIDRATLCVGDSHLGPTDVGTSEFMTSILAGALDDCLSGDGFGRNLSTTSLLASLDSSPPEAPSARELDRYIEAQVHGGVDLAHDVTSIVLDPSFRGSDVEQQLDQAADQFGFAVGWNEGSEVHPDRIEPDFRGSDMRATWPEASLAMTGSSMPLRSAAHCDSCRLHLRLCPEIPRTRRVRSSRSCGTAACGSAPRRLCRRSVSFAACADRHDHRPRCLRSSCRRLWFRQTVRPRPTAPSCYSRGAEPHVFDTR